MRKVKFILTVILMALFTRPHHWEWEYRKIKEKYQRDM